MLFAFSLGRALFFLYFMWKKSEKPTTLRSNNAILLASVVRNNILSECREKNLSSQPIKMSKIDAKNNNWCFIGKLIYSHAITNTMCIIILMLFIFYFFFHSIFRRDFLFPYLLPNCTFSYFILWFFRMRWTFDHNQDIQEVNGQTDRHNCTFLRFFNIESHFLRHEFTIVPNYHLVT